MILIEPYDPRWEAEFRAIGRGLRMELGEFALAIHHIGSTAVPGLAAKDVIDIQLTVAELQVAIDVPLARLGFVAREELRMDHRPPGLQLDERELQKRTFTLDRRRANLHVRSDGRFNQRYPLLCRDYLRASHEAATAYAETKRQLARRFPHDAEAYYDIKDPVFDIIMAGAREWSRRIGWQAPPSDA